jgi:5-methylcytosine-specific restriction protein A
LASNPPRRQSEEIGELSSRLHLLGKRLFPSDTKGPTFRNRNGVYMRLINFRRLDPLKGNSLETPDDYGAEASEGRLLTRLHLTRERNRRLVRAKLGRVKRERGHLSCEACEFDFEKTYGDRGILLQVTLVRSGA